MSKIIKFIAGAVLFVAGVVTGNPALIMTGLSIGSSALKPSPKIANSRENIDRLRASIDPRTPRKTSVGKTALATDIRDEEFTGANQDYLHRWIVVGSHKVHAISELWFDDKLAWTASGGVQGTFVGYLDVTPILEGSAANAINVSTRMGSSRRYTGCGYVYLRYKLTGNSSKVSSPFAQSVPTRITVRGDGAYFYDPRLDSTVSGGTGAHRADNQATWTWDDNACRNPALALLFYLLGWKINGLLAVGKGIPKDRIDLASFAVAANICDETVTKAGSGTEPRYRCDGVWSEGDAPTTVIDMLKATMNADLDDVDGKLRLTIFRDDTATSDADFTADDILGAFEWQQTPPLDESFNVVRGVYTDPSNNSLYQPIDYPQIEQASPDGLDRIHTADFPMVESVGQAQRLAKLRLQRQNFGGTFRAEFQATAWRVQKNSIVRLTFPPCGFVNKKFRVAEIELRVDGIVPLVLREEDPTIYVAPALVVGVAAVPSTPYDPFKNPVVTGVESPAYALAQLSGDKTVAADYLGAVTSGNLAALLWAPTVTKSGVSVKVADGTTYAISGTYGGTFAVDNTIGSTDKGNITISAISTNIAGGVLTVTVDGVALPAMAFKVTKDIAAPPASGSSGSYPKTVRWTDGDYVGINTTSYTPVVAAAKTVTLASGESLYGTFPADYIVSGGGGASRTMTLKWQYAVAGSGTWNDFAAGITGTTAFALLKGPPPDYDTTPASPGHVDVTQTKSGLAAGDYDIRLVGLDSATGRTCTVSGPATLQAKV